MFILFVYIIITHLWHWIKVHMMPTHPWWCCWWRWGNSSSICKKKEKTIVCKRNVVYVILYEVYIYIYIYVYICKYIYICVCVCVCVNVRSWIDSAQDGPRLNTSTVMPVKKKKKPIGSRV